MPLSLADQSMLQQIEREFARIGLLLQHDARMPSFTTLVSGAPIRGSWWGHPLGKRIYALLEEFSESSGRLSLKLIDGKLTYVHARLWPALMAIAQRPVTERVAELSSLAQRVFELAEQHGELRGDELPRVLGVPARRATAAIRELEERLLLHSTSIHLPSGAHAKLLRTWSGWASKQALVPPWPGLEQAKHEMGSAVDALKHGSSHEPKLAY